MFLIEKWGYNSEAKYGFTFGHFGIIVVPKMFAYLIPNFKTNLGSSARFWQGAKGKEQLNILHIQQFFTK
jgi:hypothetical protein